MKRFFLFFSLILLLEENVCSQIAPSIKWQKALGGTSKDLPQCIQVTSDKGYIVVGSTFSNDGDVSGAHGMEDVWVVKLDSLGNIQWQKAFGGSANDQAYSIQKTPDGGYIFAAYTLSNDGDVSGNHGSVDFWIVKLNSMGIIEWQKCLGGSNVDYPGYYDGSLQCTSDEGYIVVGTAISNDGQVSGNHGSSDFWIVKLDNFGNIQWQKTLGGSLDEQAWAVHEISEGGYIVAGYAQSSDGDIIGNHNYPGTQFRDFWIVKLEPSGNMQWQKCLGGRYNEEATCIRQICDGGYIVAGLSESNDGDVNGNHGGYDGWLTKISSTGILEWQKCLGGTATEYIHSIVGTSDGGYVLAVTSNSFNGDVNCNFGSLDYWIVKINSGGILEWQKCLGGSGLDEAFSIKSTPEFGYAIAGISQSTNGDITNSRGGGDFWIVNLSKDIESMDTTKISCSKKQPSPEFLIPNLITPNNDGKNDSFVIEGLKDGSTLEIYNRWGDRVYRKENYSNDDPWSGESDGIYYFVIYLQSKKEYKGWIHVIR